MLRRSRAALRHVVVDLTPLLPGGQNGGARLVPLSILPHLGSLAPEVRFTLVSNDQMYESLGALESTNVRRHRPVHDRSLDDAGKPEVNPLRTSVSGRLRDRTWSLIPERVRRRFPSAS